MTGTTRQLFELGQVAGTQATQALLARHRVDPCVLLERHSQGDWGDLAEVDRQANDLAISAGSFILSAYRIGTHRVWVVTEPALGTTTIMLPQEY